MLAIDLGGTRVKAALLEGGNVGRLEVRDHSGADLDGALRAVAEVVALLAPAGTSSVGLCLPGIVGDDGKVVVLPGKLDGAVGADLGEWLRARTGATAVVVVNDAIAYAVGEAVGLPGRTVVMTIGTGVGVAVVEDGRPLGRGPWGAGQLSGQLPLTEDGPRDTSGRAGTVEAWCRASRILEEVRAAGGDVLDVPAALLAADEGNPAALQGIARYRGWLARGVAALCAAHAPDRVVVGGGPVRPGGPLLDGLQALVDPLLWPGQTVAVESGRHGDAAALIGLAVLAS